LKAIPFPTTVKQMQSFLGAALFFKSFVPNYSALTAPFTDMIKKDFNWNETTWTTDYKKLFEEFKEALQSSTAIFYPNYELTWILRTDASMRGVGAVLLQVFVGADGIQQLQPLGFASQKFSSQASRWSTIEQEAYAIYYAVKHFSYYLRCKSFILETDHNNLLWMEASLVPKIIRWRVFLQSFSFQIRHIAGKNNLVADYLSRMHEETEAEVILAQIESSEPIIPDIEAEHVRNIDPDRLLFQVHGGRMGHLGARETWKQLNRLFAGQHRIPYRYVQDFVARCAICQKDRLGMVDTLDPIVRHLKPAHKRCTIGVDTLVITPPDENGYCLVIVIVVHYTKFTVLYPGKDHTALTVATALFQFCCSYGLFDSILSDPGSEFMNEVIKHLTEWFGMRHVFSLVDRHESNGVEGTNKQVLRHLKALVIDERVQHRWASPTVLPLVQFIINSQENSETGVVPFHAHFGSAEATYFRMPERGDSVHSAHAYIRLLDDNLKLLNDISKRHQEKIVQKRTAATPLDKQNKYQPGDLVLFQRNPDEHLPTKLTPKFVGPYEVIEQTKNDVRCRHIIMGNVQEFHVTRLKIFHGSLEDAKRVAMIDNDQYVMQRFITYRGNPEIRTTVEFEIEFADGTIVWLPWSKDLFDSVQYEDFCRSKPELYPLLYEAKTSAAKKKDLNKLPITEVEPGDIVLVDLRCYGATWYAALPLPDLFHKVYVVHYKYTSWSNRSHTKINATCAVFKEKFDSLDHDFVKRYGSIKKGSTNNMENISVIDDAMVKKYPQLLH